MERESFRDRLYLDETKGRLVDLRLRQDDKTILRNPHKGWYWHYIDAGFSQKAYRDGYERVHGDGDALTLDVLDDMNDFPGLNHLYLRFNWGDIEKQEGVLDWSYIDRIMEEWGSRGYRFAMRVCTFMGNLFDATPQWVLDAGAHWNPMFIDGQNTREPVYDDPVYLEKLENFIRQWGERYNGHPLVEYVDVGTFGVWGEGNASHLYPVESIKRHIDMHVAAFPDTPIMFNDDFIPNRSGREIVEGERQELLDYVRQRGLCLRDDSICYAPYVQSGGYDGLLVPTVYDALYANGPIDTEFCHLGYYSHSDNSKGLTPSLFQDGYRALAALQRGRVTYAGFHGYPRDFLEKYTSLAWYAANRLGYWYFLEGIQIPKLTAGQKAVATLIVSNRGFAHCAYRYDLRWRLIAADGRQYVGVSECTDNRCWEPVYVASWDACTQEMLELDLRGIPAGRYALQIGLFEGDRAIAWGMEQNMVQDGYLCVADVQVD